MNNRLSLELRRKSDKEKAKNLQRFFKTKKGEYGEGDVFLGITVPEIRKMVNGCVNLNLQDLKKSVSSKYHEERLAGLLVLVRKFEMADIKERKDLYDFYIKNKKHINNWDLVDLTAPKIVGAFLEGKDKNILYRYAKSENIWDRRIAMISCFYYIYNGDCKDAIKIAEILRNDEHDLIQKAVGWMLREVGKRCGKREEEKFLKKYYKTMPRTMLRYAIERFPEKERQFYLGK